MVLISVSLLGLGIYEDCIYWLYYGGILPRGTFPFQFIVILSTLVGGGGFGGVGPFR